MATKKKGKKVVRKQKPTASKKRRGVSASKAPVKKGKPKVLANRHSPALKTGKKPGSQAKLDGRFRGKPSKVSRPASKKGKGAAKRKPKVPSTKPKRKPLPKANPRLTTLQKSLLGPAIEARKLGLSANPAHKVNRDGSIDVQLRVGNLGKGPGSEKELNKFLTRFGKTAGPIHWRGVRINSQLFMRPEVSKEGVPNPEQYLRMVGSLPSINMQYRRLDHFPNLLGSIQSAYRQVIANGWEAQYVTINLRYDPEWK